MKRILGVFFTIFLFANEHSNTNSNTDTNFPVYMTTDQFIKMMKEKEKALKAAQENKIHPERAYEDKYGHKETKKTQTEEKNEQHEVKHQQEEISEEVKQTQHPQETISDEEKERLSKEMDSFEEKAKTIHSPSHIPQTNSEETTNESAENFHNTNEEGMHNQEMNQMDSMNEMHTKRMPKYKKEIDLNEMVAGQNMEHQKIKTHNTEHQNEAVETLYMPRNTSYYNANLLYGKVSHKKHKQPKPIHKSEWGYGNGDTGPYFWGSLKPEYKLCEVGERQTPINIKTKDVLDVDVPPLVLNYSHAEGGKFFNNGHTVEVEIEGKAIAMIDGMPYRLLQFHFHTPSENTINGEYFPMEAHFVHKSEDGKLAVISVMFKEGRENEALAKLLRRMPKNSGDKNDIEDLYVNPRKLLPHNLDYYKFNGSLTTPPCTEGVTWIVLQTPVEASAEQLREFREVMGKNNRPIQSLNGRLILK